MSLQSTLTSFAPFERSTAQDAGLDASSKDPGPSFRLAVDTPSKVEDVTFLAVMLGAGLIATHAVVWALWPSLFVLIA